MTRLLLRSALVIGCVGLFTAIGCGDDESEGASSEGQGASGASTGTGATAGGTTSDGGSGGVDPGDCTVITVENFKLAVSSEEAFAYGGLPMPALGAAGDDRFQLEVYDPAVTGTIDLGAGDQANYETCTTCVLAYEDLSEDGPPAKIYFQAEGTLELGSTTPPFIAGEMTGLKLVEVEIDPMTYKSTPVEGGGCLFVTMVEIDVVPPPEGWECPPEWYGDAVSCDCQCGILDSDCDDSMLPVFGCEEGQTCSADGTVCEGVPTAWTCAADQYGGGAGNGCDCNCGTHDPDCDIATEVLEGCQAGETCNASSHCVPAAWNCTDDFYGDVYCDCGCGVVDIDCADATVGSCEFCDDEGSCSTTDCPGTINPANNAVCG